MIEKPVQSREAADMQYEMGVEYSGMQEGSRQENLLRAIACFQAALEGYDREDCPVEWAATQHHLGNECGRRNDRIITDPD